MECPNACIYIHISARRRRNLAILRIMTINFFAFIFFIFSHLFYSTFSHLLYYKFSHLLDFTFSHLLDFNRQGQCWILEQGGGGSQYVINHNHGLSVAPVMSFQDRLVGRFLGAKLLYNWLCLSVRSPLALLCMAIVYIIQNDSPLNLHPPPIPYVIFISNRSQNPLPSSPFHVHMWLSLLPIN